MAVSPKILAKLREFADDKPELYRDAAESVLAPKINGDKNKVHDRLVGEINLEYQEGWEFVKPKLREGMTRLKLYNNQRRDKSAVGDPLLFATHQTVIAALYYDKLSVEFEPREEGDEDVAWNTNALAEFDQDEMWKAETDYEWDWDAGMFGRSLIFFNEFDTKSKTPIPEVWDPLTFIRDPHAVSVNGNRQGKGALRYGYRDVQMTKWEMKANPEYFNLNALRPTGKSAGSLTAEADRLRKDAQGLTAQEGKENRGENALYTITQGFHYIGGKKYWVELGNERQVLIRITPLGDFWPLIDRPMYPMAHDWDGVSIPDIVEDKQRFRAEMLNIYGNAAKADLYPMYLMNSSKISRGTDLSFGFNKVIPINGPVGDNVMAPLRKASLSPSSSFILDFLDQSVQRALATPEIRQGVPSKDQRTLGENQLISAGVDTRYSLTARIWGWSERAFWRQWYSIYERDFADGVYKKAVRLTGPFGPRFRELKRKDIIASCPQGLDIKIESRELSEARKQRAFNSLSQFYAGAINVPGFDSLYAFRKLGKQIMPKDEVERVLPLTVDERMAKQENEKLEANEAVEVKLEDNHVVHLRMHATAGESPAATAHIKAHEEAIIVKRAHPELFPVTPEDMAMNPQNSMSKMGPAIVNATPPASPSSSQPGPITK